ncbi:MAG: NADH-quinone oxidoreductase subunit NuoH [Gemmataceae bacterium]
MIAFDWLTLLIVIAGVIAVVMPTVGYLTLAERKVSAWVQDRLGPNRVGPLGLLQPLADGGKFFLKEAPIPRHVDKIFFLLAPAVSMAIALTALAVVPWGGTQPPPNPVPVSADAIAKYQETQAGYSQSFNGVILPGLDVGVLVVFALGSLSVYGIILGGWSSDNKYSLLGSLRSSAQIISYEIPLGMSVVGVLLFSGTLNLEGIIQWQKQHGWFLVYQPLAFLLFMVSVYAECNRLPFDLPEAEQELVGGYLTEYGSLNFGMFMLGEYTHMITTSLLMTVVFCGGWSLFGLENQIADPIWAAVVKCLILVAKTGFFLFLYLLVRWTIPRFRFDQLMGLAWKVMIPLSLLHLLAAMLVRQYDLSNWVLTAISVGLFLAAGVYAVAFGTGPNNAPRRRVVVQQAVV